MGMSMLVQRFNKLNASLVEYFHYIQDMNKVNIVLKMPLYLLKSVVITVSADVQAHNKMPGAVS